MFGSEPDDPDSQQDLVYVVGTDQHAVTQLAELVQMQILATSTGRHRLREWLYSQTDYGPFVRCSHILLCIDASHGSLCLNVDTTTLLSQTYSRAKNIQANVLVLFYNHRESTGMTSLLRHPHLSSLCSQNGILQNLDDEDHVLSSGPLDTLTWNEAQLNTLHEWISDGHLLGQLDMNRKRPEDEKMVFHVVRESIPDMKMLVRLLAMSLLGVTVVLATFVLLVIITPDVQKSDADVERARLYLVEWLLNQRTGDLEWNHRHAASAIFALQSHDSHWCHHSVESQRSVDRMEMGLLAVLSRIRQYSSRELTTSRLSHYIMALTSVKHTPRNFHGHNLVEILRRHLNQRAVHSMDSYALSWGMLGLCITGEELKSSLVNRLLGAHGPQGGFTFGVDEASLVVMALSCAPNDAARTSVVNASLQYIARHRRIDSSYGSVYSTALVLQAISLSPGYFPIAGTADTFQWLVRQVRSDITVRNVDVAAQVLMTLSGKTIISLRTASTSLASHQTVGLSAGYHLVTLCSELDVTRCEVWQNVQKHKQHKYRVAEHRNKRTRTTCRREPFIPSMFATCPAR